MKTLLCLILAALSLTATAQTYANYSLSFVAGNASTNIVVPTNTTATLLSFLTSATVTSGFVGATYPSGAVFLFDASQQQVSGFPILGPCTIQLSGTGTGSPHILALVRFDVVNTGALPGELLVQPSGSSATVTLQSSTNLSSWQTATNGNYAKGQNRFFRIALTLQ